MSSGKRTPLYDGGQGRTRLDGMRRALGLSGSARNARVSRVVGPRARTFTRNDSCDYAVVLECGRSASPPGLASPACLEPRCPDVQRNETDACGRQEEHGVPVRRGGFDQRSHYRLRAHAQTLPRVVAAILVRRVATSKGLGR